MAQEEVRENKLTNILAPYLRKNTTSREFVLTRGLRVRVVEDRSRADAIRVIVYRIGHGDTTEGASLQEAQIVSRAIIDALRNIHPDRFYQTKIDGPRGGRMTRTDSAAANTAVGYSITWQIVSEQKKLVDFDVPF